MKLRAYYRVYICDEGPSLLGEGDRVALIGDIPVQLPGEAYVHLSPVMGTLLRIFEIVVLLFDTCMILAGGGTTPPPFYLFALPIVVALPFSLFALLQWGHQADDPDPSGLDRLTNCSMEFFQGIHKGRNE